MRKFLTLLLLLVMAACQSESRKPLPELIKSMELVTPRQELIKTRLVFTDPDQVQGLSGIKDSEFENNEGMLFFYLEDGEKAFWMPDTYFDLDLFYLDHELKIIDVVRRLPHHVGRLSPELIPRARGVWCRHVLELKASSPIAEKLQIGEKLTWKGQYSLPETEQKIREYLKR